MRPRSKPRPISRPASLRSTSPAGRAGACRPPTRPRPPRGDRVRNLDFLFGALKAAPDDASAKHIEDRIWALWLASRSDTRHLLMTRVKTAVDAENYHLALRLLDAIIELKPKYVEAWNARATVFSPKQDYGSAV